jgi:hypothetical protein
MGAWWKSCSNKFNSALSNLNLKSNNNSQMKWHFQTTAITNFKKSCQLNELKRFEEALALIPNLVVFNMYVIISFEYIPTNYFFLSSNLTNLSIIPVKTASPRSISTSSDDISTLGTGLNLK